MSHTVVMWAVLLPICGAGVHVANAGSDSSDGVAQKVIQLLTDMSVKAKAEKQAETVEYAKFAQFCQDKTASKTVDIKKGAQLISSLSADIAKLDSDIADLDKKLNEFQDQITKSKAGQKEAQAQREVDHRSYTEIIEAHAEAVDALERAIAMLQRQNHDHEQASALLQLAGAGALPDSAKRAVAAFLEMQTGDDFLTRAGPEANAYEFQSEGIVSLLKKLLTEFTEKHTESQKEEINSKHAFSMIMQDLSDTVENAESDIADSTARLEEKKALRTQDMQRLKSTTETHDEDVKFLSDLKIECEEKGRSYQEKQGLRAEEIQVVEKAIEILQSQVLDATQHLSALPQLGRALVQLSSTPESPETRRAANFLKNEGHRLRNQQLGLLAQQIISSSDPFGKVKKLILDLIQKLLREMGEEAEHKGWCDTEMGTNKKTRTKLQRDIDGLQARIDEGEATITDITERLAALATEVQDLVNAKKKATELRASEKVKNQQAIEDARAAQLAIASATSLLKEFYAKAGRATALIQKADDLQPIQYDRIGNEHVKMGSTEWNSLANPNVDEVDRGHKEGMQTFGKTYKGRQDEAGSILAVLEVLASDFSSLEADTKLAEEQAVRTFKTFMADSSKDVSVKEAESTMLRSNKMEAEARLDTDTRDIKSNQDQMLAAERYYERLKPQCIDQGVTWSQRQKSRQDEIQSLKEALRMLTGDDTAGD